MRIEIEKHISDEVLAEIKKGLKKSRQLKPYTLSKVKDYAREWAFLKDDNDDVMGFMAIKKSQREGFETELGFIYVYPSHNFEDVVMKLLQFVLDEHYSDNIYAEVLLTPIKKVFKKLGYKKIDEWDSEVRKGQKVELFTNQNLEIIDENYFLNYMKKLIFIS